MQIFVRSHRVSGHFLFWTQAIVSPRMNRISPSLPFFVTRMFECSSNACSTHSTCSISLQVTKTTSSKHIARKSVGSFMGRQFAFF
eukprot:jgi/Antlo1/190/926